MTGHEWKGACDVDERDHMFVFLKSRKVVAFVYFNGRNSEKKGLAFKSYFGYDGKEAFTPQSAVFIAKKNASGEILIDY
ncbi:hypothetical protein [Xanthocytophaga agilis]|uniref:Uncharacterized protein n=1 Tax=Xanthocytophaga agilis TaxID=3048010 RepID=A0AAE3UJH0_9BACT|nr:hypothetical protein [Xanthocytophaga agilis]MDJ1506821.1 hypothetical protein [Xanthocytophaga agilis]